MLIFPIVSGPDFSWRWIFVLTTNCWAESLLKDSPNPSRHPYALPTPRYPHRCLRISGLHGITIKALSVDLQVRDPGVFHILHYIFMVWGGGGVAFKLVSRGFWQKMQVWLWEEKIFPSRITDCVCICLCTCVQGMCEGVFPYIPSNT